ncbi:MAG TPA: SRPBCC family protein [Puia sp.]|nr:SRPBCC family protein [Puia sp.]
MAAYYFFIFPNLMFNFYPWGLSVNLVKPLGLSRTRISFLTYIADPGRYNTGAGSGLDTVELEDEAVVEAVQKGVRSRFYSHGRYSVTREQGTHHFHRLIAESIG